MPSPIIIMAIVLAISLAGNGLLAKFYVGAKEDYATEKANHQSYLAQEKVIGEKAAKEAAETKAADEKRKKDADNENAATVANLNAAIAKLRAKPDRSRGGSVPPAPAGSKCPPDQTCFDRAEYQRAVGDFDSAARRLADEGSAVAVDMNTALKWATSLNVR